MIFTYLRSHDLLLNTGILVLVGAGFLILSSIAPHLMWLQLMWVSVGFLFILGFSLLDWRTLVNYRWMILGIYFGSLGLLVLNLICIEPFFCLAPVIRGTRGWLVLGPIRIQTAELAKVAFLVLLAYFFAKRHVGIAHFGTIARSFFYLALPAFLILQQPDMGSAIVLFGIWAGFLLVSGIRLRHLAVGTVIIILVSVVGWGFLAGYQQDRIVGFFNPDFDPLGVNYNVIQSKIAIGSAGFFGKGFGQGTQVQLGFLPEAPTDFIFAAFIEEWGLLGGMLVLVAFVLILLRIVSIGLRAENNFFRFICMGAVIMFLIQFALNAGSALGILPVVGVTFPFFSYGGSSLLTNALLVGIIQSIAIRSPR
jgi:rod shape determining protein RodA